MPITIIQKGQQRQETSKITLSRPNVFQEDKRKFSALITSLPENLSIKDLKTQIFKDFDPTYQKLDDNVFLAYCKDKQEVMRFCAKYNLAEINNKVIKVIPIIKLEQENIFEVKLKK